MTRLILVRHGEANVAVDRLISSEFTCTGLTPLGFRQAESLASRLRTTGEINADVLISSRFRRAIQTAEAIAPVLNLPIEQLGEFGEHSPGPLVDGLTYAQFVEQYPGFTWSDDPYVAGFPGGETIAQFRIRVGAAVSAVLGAHAGKTVVIVCHGGVIDCVFRRFVNTPMSGGFELYTLNTALSEFVSTDRGTWSVVRYNDAAHIAGLPSQTVP